MEQNGEKRSGHWWEYYAVRYALGTIVGAMIVWRLCQADPVLRPLLLDNGTAELNASRTLSVPRSDATDLTLSKEKSGTPKTPPSSLPDLTGLVLLAIYGWAYCYTASAPVLVFHSGRFLLAKGEFPCCVRKGWSWCILGFVVVCASVAFASFLWPSLLAYTLTVPFVGLSFFLLAVVAQFLVIGCTILRKKQLYEFYRSLGGNRKNGNNEVVDSYRHLREHGNAFFILSLEVLLALAFLDFRAVTQRLSGTAGAVAEPLAPYLLTVLIWILPASLVWLIAVLVEIPFGVDPSFAPPPSGGGEKGATKDDEKRGA